MMTLAYLIIYGFVALVVLPLAVLSLMAGSPAPENTLFTKYYRAEPRLMLVGNLFLVVIGGTAIARLAQHFGFVDDSLAGQLDLWLGIPFALLLVVFLVLFARAIFKVRRAQSTGGA